ncbi:MAG: type II toxin-antitoxin system VapC family toxin [Ginsengibacter sp.]
MGIKYLWDTNTVIYYLQQLLPPNAEQFLDELNLQDKPTISAITEIELLCWKPARDKDMDVVQNFIYDALVIELEQAIKLKTAEIRKIYNIKLPDAIIAATAIVYDLTLLSRNISDFKNINDLKFINCWDI